MQTDTNTERGARSVKIGRPYEIPTETFQDVCLLTLELDEKGERVGIAKACKTLGISTANFYQRCVSDQALAEFYARTRKAQSLSDLDELSDIEDDVLAGRVAPEVAKVVIGSKQWRMARLHRALFGDQVQIDANVTKTFDFSGLSPMALAELGEQLRAKGFEVPTLPGPIIENEPKGE